MFKLVMSVFKDAMVVSSAVMVVAIAVDVKNLIVYERISSQSIARVFIEYLAVVGD